MKRTRLANEDIRKSIKKAGLMYWQVFMKMGISEATFSRLLRTELELEDKQRILDAVNELNEGR